MSALHAAARVTPGAGDMLDSSTHCARALSAMIKVEGTVNVGAAHPFDQILVLVSQRLFTSARGAHTLSSVRHRALDF